jgi:hypothetical protein
VKLAKKLRRSMKIYRIRIGLLEKQLEKASDKNEQVRNWLRLLDRLSGEMPEDARERRFAKWTALQQSTAVKQLATYGSVQQKLLQQK